jgi:hypothetical protein
MKEFSKTFAEEMKFCTLCEHSLCPGSALVVLLQCRYCGHEKCDFCSKRVDALEECYSCCQCAKAVDEIAEDIAVSDDDETAPSAGQEGVEDSRRVIEIELREIAEESHTVKQSINRDHVDTSTEDHGLS